MTTDNDRKRVAELFGTTPLSLGFYFRVYDSLLARGDGYVLPFESASPGDPTPPKPITHSDVLKVAAILRHDPTVTLDEVAEQLKAQTDTVCFTHQLKSTILLSAQALFMLDFTGPVDSWQPSERFIDFVSRSIPTAARSSAAARSAIENQ
ncbi:hypothetical protein NEMBOFW57_006762, partial [Staphylotrichum longicolle]